ncbi:MAG: hypothetical protein R2795_24795 [Saprospiraceae bacterium]
MISFAVSGTISLATTLPTITEGLTIDGSTAPGYAVGSPSVVLFGLPSDMIYAQNATGIVVTGLHFQNGGVPSAGAYRGCELPIATT